MLEEGNVSIVEYGQELPSDTTTETPETTAKTTVSTTQRVPWKVQVSTSMDQLESNHAPFAFRALGCFVAIGSLILRA